MQQPEELMLHCIKCTLFILDLRVVCPNWASPALYECNDKVNVTLELCVALHREKASPEDTLMEQEESKAEMKESDKSPAKII